MIDNGKYVESQDFQLKFLRADRFDVKKAAKRLTTHCELLKKYYGNEGLTPPLRFDDLSNKEQSIAREGFYQILPQRDRSGRLVCFHYRTITGDGITSFNRVSMLYGILDVCASTVFRMPSDSLNLCFFQVRFALYYSSTLSEDVESQKKGMVLIVNSDRVMVNNYLTATRLEKTFWIAGRTFPFEFLLNIIAFLMIPLPCSK